MIRQPTPAPSPRDHARERAPRSSALGWLLAASIVFGIAIRSPAAEPDRWEAFRAEQRAEVATLPKVPDPEAAPGRNPIDALMDGWMKANGVEPRPQVEDRALARRIHLDAVGLLPTPEAVEAFASDPSPGKATELAEALLADRRGYAEHWISFWNDLLRNDEQTAIDGLRKPITKWLYQSLHDNAPYDRMVVELLSPGAEGPDGYLLGVNWRGRVNLSQRPPVQAAQNLAQVFLATSIRCASCHDGFTTPWKLKDAYALAGFFSDGPLEIARCDKPIGTYAAPKFLYPDLGEVAADADLPTRRAAVARMVVRPKNSRFARVIANRLWDRLLGRALAEPIDEMGEADCPEVLDWLAADFMAHDYDLKRTIGLILGSEAYRRRAAPGVVDEGEPEVGPVPRRLSSEQFLDAIAAVTGSWPKPKPKTLVVLPLEGEQVRAWRQKRPGALSTALGRPNREQVVTRRNQEATVLQALEATNGVELSTLLSAGAEALLGSPWGAEADPALAIDVLFQRSLARPASAAEREALAPLIGKPGDPAEDRKAGVEDVLWIVVNGPEFQIIR